MPDDIQALLDSFRSAREAFLNQQKELLKQLEGATDEQRQALREQLAANMAAFREDARTKRQEIVERLRELRGQLPGHGELIDQLKTRLDERRNRRGDGN